MAPSCLVQSSIAANQGNTHSRKLFMVSSVAILLSTPTQRAAMWRTAVYGCWRQVNKWGRCSNNCRKKQKSPTIYIRCHGFQIHDNHKKMIKVNQSKWIKLTKGLSSAAMAPAMTSSTCRELTNSWAAASPLSSWACLSTTHETQWFRVTTLYIVTMWKHGRI